jgi:hypothetical protein
MKWLSYPALRDSAQNKFPYIASPGHTTFYGHSTTQLFGPKFGRWLQRVQKRTGNGLHFHLSLLLHHRQEE